MNLEPHVSEPSFELPPPEGKSPKLHIGEEQAGLTSAEEAQNTIAVEQGAGLPSPTATSGSPPVTQGAASPPSLPASDLSLITSMGTPQIADDGDLIEKEWVEKAKEIVDRNKTDPYAQNEEINRVKADYLKKRYNKDIKLGENI